MNRFFLSFSVLIVFIVNCFTVRAQDHDSQFSAGIENTRLIYGQYTLKNHYFAKVNMSVYSENIDFQYIRATLGYKTSKESFGFNGSYFFGSALNGSYYNTGVKLTGSASIKRLLLDATLAPWYDSGYEYNTCYEAKIGCRITDEIDVKAGYTTVPEYRMSEHRLIGCFDFHVQNLSVEPYISIGTKSKEGGKNVRVGFGFCYQF